MAQVLIVEDDRASARLLSVLLRKGNHHATITDTLESARNWLFNQADCDVMILDNRLGDNYGWELVEELRAHFYFRDLPVIVYTAAGDRDSVSKYVELKVQAIQTKPYKWEVLSTEIDKAVKTAWQARDFVDSNRITERFNISTVEYIGGLRDAGKLLRSTADNLLQLLIPSKERQFLSALNELRSTVANFGLNIVMRVIKEAVEAFRAQDWSRAVKAIRTLDIVAIRLDRRVAALEENRPKANEESAESLSIEFLVDDEIRVEESRDQISNSIAGDMPSGFSRMAGPIAQGDTIEIMVRQCVRGVMQGESSRNLLESLGSWIQWLAFLEPNDLESVVLAVREGNEIEARLRNQLRSKDLSGETLREIVSERGVFQSGLITATLRFLDELKREDFPVRLKYLATRQMLTAHLVRAIAARIQRAVNLEAVIWLHHLGEWVFALRYPGVYGLILLEPGAPSIKKYQEAFAMVGRPVLAKLNLPAYCKDSLKTDGLEGFNGQGASRLSVGLLTLGQFINEAYCAESRGREIETIRKEFIESEAWNLLAEENLKLPSDRNKFFESLLAAVPTIYGQVNALLTGEASSASTPLSL